VAGQSYGVRLDRLLLGVAPVSAAAVTVVLVLVLVATLLTAGASFFGASGCSLLAAKNRVPAWRPLLGTDPLAVSSSSLSVSVTLVEFS